MLEKEFLGNTVQDWGVSILFVIGAYLIRKLASWIGKKYVGPFTKRTHHRLDDIIYNSVESPLLFAIMLIGFWIAIHRLNYPDTLAKAVESAYKMLVVLNITWLFAKLICNLLEQYWARNTDGIQPHRMYPIVNRTLLATVWIIGFVIALNNVGVNIGALLGTLGIGGIAFALAAQDTVKNIFGAFTILTDKPFNIGDTVRIDSFEGTIVDVGIRSTKIRDYDQRVITIPNYRIADASIINISSEDPYRRVVMRIGLTYDTTPVKMQKAMDLLRSVPLRVQHVKQDEVTVFFSDFGDSALVITFIYFIEKNAGVQAVTSKVNMEILTSFNSAGLCFAFPSQTLYIAGHADGCVPARQV
jgi:MscS family membrane protein